MPGARHLFRFCARRFQIERLLKCCRIPTVGTSRRDVPAPRVSKSGAEQPRKTSQTPNPFHRHPPLFYGPESTPHPALGVGQNSSPNAHPACSLSPRLLFGLSYPLLTP